MNPDQCIIQFINQWNQELSEHEQKTTIQPLINRLRAPDTGSEAETVEALGKWIATECAPIWLHAVGFQSEVSLLANWDKNSYQVQRRVMEYFDQSFDAAKIGRTDRAFNARKEEAYAAAKMAIRRSGILSAKELPEAMPTRSAYWSAKDIIFFCAHTLTIKAQYDVFEKAIEQTQQSMILWLESLCCEVELLAAS